MDINSKHRLTSTIYSWAGFALYALLYAFLYIVSDWSPKLISSVALGVLGPSLAFSNSRAAAAIRKMEGALPGKKPAAYADVLVDAIKYSVEPEIVVQYCRSQKALFILGGALIAWMISLVFILKTTSS